MKKGLVKQFEEQFGKEWVCVCQTPFNLEGLKIISENRDSLIAHYTCPSCQREQMLAAAINSQEETQQPRIKLPKTTVSADDVLDIKAEIKQLKIGAIRNLDRNLSTKSKRRSAIEAGSFLPPDLA